MNLQHSAGTARRRVATPDIGEAGTMMMVPKESLTVDHDYQRAETKSKTAKIRDNFSWPAFGALVVILRPDGNLVIVEGQHRHAAAMARADVTSVPCIIYEVDHVALEAAIFLACNKERKPVTTAQSFKAMAVAGSAVAADVRGLAEANGFTVDHNSNVNAVRCPGALVSLMRDRPEHVAAVFPLVADLCRGDAIDARTIRAFTHLHEATDGAILDPRWTEKVIRLGIQNIRDAMTNATRLMKRTDGRVWAIGILEAVNFRSRANRLAMDVDLASVSIKGI